MTSSAFTRRTLRAALTLGILHAAVAGAQSRAQPGPPSADTLRLTVADAVTRMLRLSDETRIADAQVELADAQILSARAAGLPQLRLASTYSQTIKNARATVVGSVFGQSYTYNTNLLLQQSFFQGGRIVAGSQVAARNERAAVATRDELRAAVAVDAQRAYLNAIFTARLADIQRQNLTLADERLAQVEQLERAGRSSRYDVLRARVERANLEPLALQAESNRTLAELELKRLLQIPLARPTLLTTELAGDAIRALADSAATDLSPPGVRPGVRATELSASARDAAIKLARADLLPTVSASFTLGYLALPSANGLPDRIGKTSNAYCPAGSPATRVCQNNGWFPDRSFGVQMSWPLFDGLRAKGAIDLAQAQAKIADYQVQQAREQANVDVQRALAELTRARAAFSARATNVSEAEEAFQLATLRYGRGVGTQLEVSDAQLALLTARSTEARATFDLFLAVAEMARARARPIPLPGGGTVALGTTR